MTVVILKTYKLKQRFNFSEASLGLVSRLLTAIILCVLVSYLLFIFYGIYLPALQTLVQSQNMGEGGNSKENIFALQAMKLPCMKKKKIVYLKTHKVGNCIFVISSVQLWGEMAICDIDCI